MNINTSEISTNGGIYCFTNILNNKIYIGSAENLRKRFIKHISNLKNNTHHSKHFQNAWNKYGEESFEYSILEYIDNNSKLLEREQYYLNTLLFAQEYIKKENTKFLELGYNINPCASNRFGTTQTKESIKKSIINNKNILPVLWFDFYGNLLGEFISSGEASKASGINRGLIYSCCKHQQEYTHEYLFIYKNEFEYYKEYLKSLHDSPFIPKVWNKNLSFRPKKDDSLILFDRYGRFIDTFSYQTDVSKFIGCSTSNLSNCKNKKIIKNYLLFDLSFDYLKVIEKIRNENYFIYTLSQVTNKIMMYDNFNNFISGFETVEEASKITNLNSNSIYNVLCGKRKQIKGYIFKYYEDIV